MLRISFCQYLPHPAQLTVKKAKKSVVQNGTAFASINGNKSDSLFYWFSYVLQGRPNFQMGTDWVGANRRAGAAWQPFKSSAQLSDFFLGATSYHDKLSFK